MIRILLFPARCPVCEAIVRSPDQACEVCTKTLPYLTQQRCKRCSKAVEEVEAEYCYDCSKRLFHYDYGRAVWNYNKSMALSIARFKYHNKKEYAKWYAKEMYREWTSQPQMPPLDVIIPIPIHIKKYHYRGYTQEDLLAKEFSK